LLQVRLPLQAMPQAPQLNLSVCVFTQFPAGQRVRPGVHTHVPALHISPFTAQPRLLMPQ